MLSHAPMKADLITVTVETPVGRRLQKYCERTGIKIYRVVTDAVLAMLDKAEKSEKAVKPTK